MVFAYDKCNVAQSMISSYDRLENMRKQEEMLVTSMFCFSTMFSKALVLFQVRSTLSRTSPGFYVSAV